MDAVKLYGQESSCKINIFTLGRFEIRHQNKAMYQITRSTKLWDLFKYLLVHNGKGIAPEIIIEDLYPDDSYKSVKNNLQNNIYRLRKLLSEDHFFSDCDCDIVFSNGCYAFSLSDRMDLDTDRLEKNYQIANFCKLNNPDEAIKYYEKAFSVYDGDYLPELVYEDWVIPKRNYYRRKYIQSVLYLTELYNQKQLYDDSIRVCEKSLQIAPYEEDINICFMESLIGKGSINEAQKHYAYITGALYKQFGIKPTAEMQNIYKMLNKHNIQPKRNPCFEDLLEGENSESGAFYCDEKVFRSLFILEQRRSERTGEPVFLVSIILENYKELSEHLNVFQQLETFLVHSLRKSDAATIWSDYQLLFMLSNINPKHIRDFMTDKIKKFERSINFKNLNIKLDVQSFLPNQLVIRAPK